MRKKFFSNLFFVIVLNVLIKPIWVFGIDRGVQNLLGFKEYGLYFALSSFSLLLNIIIDMGITYYNNRVISQDNSIAKNLLPQIIGIKILLTVIYIALTLLIAVLWNITGYALWLLIVLCFNQILISFILYLRSNLSAFLFFKVDSLLSITDKVLMLIFFSIFLFSTNLKSYFNIEWFIYGQTICYTLTFLIAIIVNISYIGKMDFSINYDSIKEIWNKSYPYAIVIFFMAIYTRIDGVMIERISGAHEAGIYASAYRLLDAANQFGYLFAVLLLPIFSKMISTKSSITEILKASYTAIIIFSSVVIIISILYSNEIMNLLYHNSTHYNSRVFKSLMISMIGTSTVYVFGTLLAANANLKELNIITAIAMVFNVVINYFMITRYGAIGASYVAVSTNLLVAAFEIFIIYKIFKLQIDYSLIVRMILYIIISVILCSMIKQYLHTSFIIQCFMSVAVMITMAFGFQLFYMKRILDLLRMKSKD
jgi:O-antigen/teichoic acid export membrane protein